MSQDQYQKGLTNINDALQAALHDRAIAGASVDVREQAGTAREARVTLSANGMTQTEIFTYQEIEDSGEAIDAPAAHKVRMLVSHFVR